jgi:hypothetical protein
MNIKSENNRRQFIQKVSIGLFGLTLSENLFGQNKKIVNTKNKIIYDRYPAIDEELTYNVVSASHFDFEKVKELVTKRPELAKASWDWGFGDFETALGACSHTGRRDIAEFLISYGARPDIFTFAMLGMLESVKEIMKTFPGIQTIKGPHGITLWKHVQTRLAHKDITKGDKANVQKVADYLEKLGNANILAESIEMTENDKKIFLGDYKFGEAENDIFTIENSKSMPNYIRIVRKGMPGNMLLKTDENTFSPTGAPSVKIKFDVKDNKVNSLTIYEPEPIITAIKKLI